MAIALETLGGGFRGQRWKERSRNRAEGARALVLPSVTAVSHLSSTCWPQNLPLPVPSGSEQGLSVGKGREGNGGEKLPGQPSQVLSLPVGILQGRKQSCSRGARCSPRGAERRPAQSQAERLVPSPASAPQLLRAAAPFKTPIWAPARARVAGLRGCAGRGAPRAGNHFSSFQERLSPSSSSSSDSQPPPPRETCSDDSDAASPTSSL